MTYEWIVFFSLFLAFICALCISILIISNTTQNMLYEFKKEFRKFRDGEQYQCSICENVKPKQTDNLYHLYCEKCGYDWWCSEAFPDKCPNCNCDRK